ncbi:hypothetical protein N7534_003566 [Penicillium rubens]|nr:hypothetical protein N7524_003631 [Penicillium chrysogenum]KAJ5858289.1 hypothetical protein N7534_003566 [Penicillium rubens]
MSVPCELALVQHASLVAKPELAALGDLRVRIVFDLERKIVNLCTLRPARNLLPRKPGLTAMHASHAAWKNRFVRVDHLARTALQREKKSAHLIWKLTRRFVQEKDAHGPAYRVAYGKFVALAEGLLVEHVLPEGLKFMKTTEDHPGETGIHATQNQYNGNGELSRNAVMEEAIQQPESTPDERPENWPSPNTLTALDTRQHYLAVQKKILRGAVFLTICRCFTRKPPGTVLLTNDPPFEPSPTSLKAIVLIIYGRTHRGADVFSNLQLAYHTASSTKCHIDTTQCVVEPMVCAEYRQLLIGLKMLFLLNAQMHDYYRNRDITQGIERRADIYKSTERPHLPISVEGSPTTQMTFTILNLQLLEISDKICVGTERGLMSEWSLAGLETELFRIEKQCSEIYTEVSESDSQLGSHPGIQGILHCYINYLLHLLFLPDLQRYLNGNIAPGTRISQLKCIVFANASLQCFNLLAEDMQSKSYGWYIRGLGSYYAEQSAYTLSRSRAALQENDQYQEVRSILKRFHAEHLGRGDGT